MRRLSSLSLSGGISGIVGSFGSIVLAVDAREGVLHAVSVRGRRLRQIASTQLELRGSQGSWSSLPYPFVEVNDYIRTNGFSCSITAMDPTGEVVAVSAPGIPLTLFSLPELRVMSQFGGVGEARELCWTRVPGHLLLTRLVGKSSDTATLRSEAYILEIETGQRTQVSPTLLGRALLSPEMLITLRVEQAYSKLNVHEAQPPYRTHDLQLTLNVRPDGLAFHRERNLLAILELDESHHLYILEVGSWDQRFCIRYAGETTRPTHAHDLGLIAFDPQGAAAYVPGPKGSIYCWNLLQRTAQVFEGRHGEVVGLVHAESERVLVSADECGDLHLWEFEPFESS